VPTDSHLFHRVRRLLRADAASRAADDSGPPEADEPRPAPEPATEGPSAAELERLEAEAKHHRARLDLYRARTYAVKPTSLARLRELERTASGADERLQDARRRKPALRPRD
jgi:hypothetical protein